MIVLLAFGFLALGALAGAVHFTAVARDADLLVYGGSALVAIRLRIGRLMLTVAIFVLAALAGHWPALLAATIGFTVARQVVIHRLGTPA